MLVKTLNEQEFDSFASKHEYSSYYQSSSYGYLMSNYGLKPIYLGIYDGTKLLGASLILYKAPIMGFKYGYAPRGLLIDYANYNDIINITKTLKNYLFKQRFIVLKMDPLVLCTKRNKEGAIVDTNEKKNNIMEALKTANYYHCGYNNGFESLKPRWLAYLDLTKNESELFNSFSKAVKNKIKKANRLGVEIYKDNNAIEKVYPLIEKKGNYSLNYYKDLLNCFGNNAEIYVAKINSEKFVENSKLLYEKELEYNGYLNNIISRDGYKGKNPKDTLSKKMESDKLLIHYKEYLVQSIDLLKEHPDGLIIGCSIIIKNANTVHLVIDGYNKEYGRCCPLYLSRWQIIKDHLNSEYSYFDMNAITGIFEDNNPYKNLNDVKFGYSTIAHEYIGELNLIINTPMYNLYKNVIIEDSLRTLKK